MNRTPSSDETSDEETTYLLNHGEVVFSQDMSDSTALNQSQQVYNLRLHKVLFFIFAFWKGSGYLFIKIICWWFQSSDKEWLSPLTYQVSIKRLFVLLHQYLFLFLFFAFATLLWKYFCTKLEKLHVMYKCIFLRTLTTLQNFTYLHRSQLLMMTFDNYGWSHYVIVNITTDVWFWAICVLFYN